MIWPSNILPLLPPKEINGIPLERLKHIIECLYRIHRNIWFYRTFPDPLYYPGTYTGLIQGGGQDLHRSNILITSKVKKNRPEVDRGWACGLAPPGGGFRGKGDCVLAPAPPPCDWKMYYRMDVLNNFE